MNRKLRPWQYVRNVASIRNLPPYCEISDDFDGNPIVTPNKWDALSDCPNIDDVPDNFRGFVVSVSDHGNVSLLMRFRNGNTREIWGVV